jgi:hypothetical protein
MEAKSIKGEGEGESGLGKKTVLHIKYKRLLLSRTNEKVPSSEIDEEAL